MTIEEILKMCKFYDGEIALLEWVQSQDNLEYEEYLRKLRTTIPNSSSSYVLSSDFIYSKVGKKFDLKKEIIKILNREIEVTKKKLIESTKTISHYRDIFPKILQIEEYISKARE